jgi:hypothetical protein
MTATQYPVVTDALLLPVIALRGLWDRFAPPGSLGALQRAYLRGVPSLVRWDDGDAPLTNALRIVADPTVNCRRQPLYLTTDGPPSTGPGRAPAPSWMGTFAIDARSPADETRVVYRRRARADARHEGRACAWSPIGRYVPVAAWIRGLTGDDFAGDTEPLHAVWFESANVAPAATWSSRPAGGADTGVLAAIRAIVGPRVQVVRVSDLVELDLLDRSLREAA